MSDSATSLLCVAVDAGFGGIKAALVCDGQLRTAHVPAVVGVGEINLGLLESGITRQDRKRPYVLTTGGRRYLVGPHVERFATPIERLDFDRLAPSPELQALTYTGLGRLLAASGLSPDGQPVQAELAAVIGLPVQVLQGAEAVRTTQGLSDWLVGEHSFELDDRPFSLRVRGIKAMAQPMGAFFEWGLDPGGQWARSASDLKATVGILDLGFNTLDLVVLSGGQIVRRYTDGTTLGLRRGARVLQELFAARTGRRVSLHQADQYLQQAGRGGAEVLVGGEPFNLKPLARQALDVAAGEVRAYLSQVWEDGSQFDYLLFTGGGVLALGERLRSAFPRAVELAEPVTANARGLARFAQRRGLFEAQAVR